MPDETRTRFDRGVADEVARLWEEYRDEGSAKARERLILHYSPLVKFVAGRVGAGLPPSVEYADLVSYGFLGLIDAMEKFDRSRDIKFETYAIPRIRGSILDELRALDWVPRSVRSKARQIQRAVQRLHNTLRRDPTDEELAEELSLDVSELQDQLGQVAAVSVVALEELLTVGSDGGDQVSVLDTLPDTDLPRPGESLEAAETRQALLQAIGEMRERERMVITLYYFEGLTLAQIGEVLGVTESRVSQIHSKSVLFLRSRMGAREEHGAPKRR